MKENLTLLLPPQGGDLKEIFQNGWHLSLASKKRRRPFQAKDRACIKAEKSESTKVGTGKGALDQCVCQGGAGWDHRSTFGPYLASPPVSPALFLMSTSCWHLWGLAVKVMAFIDLREFTGNIGHRIIWGLWLPPPTQAWDFKIQALSPILTLSYGKSITLLA